MKLELILFLIIIISTGVAVRFMKRRMERFSNVLDSITTQEANTQVATYNLSQTNTPCKINTREGSQITFQAEGHDLGWFAVPGEPNTCQLDLRHCRSSRNLLCYQYFII
jgi:hypothetical protein